MDATTWCHWPLLYPVPLVSAEADVARNQKKLVQDFILHNLHSGATIYEAVGAYDGVRRQEIETIVDRSEYQKLITFIDKMDPEAFVTVYTVNDIRYRPKIKK